MLHTFLHDGLLRRFALFFSADLPKRATSDPKRLPVLIIFLHDRVPFQPRPAELQLSQ